MYDEEGKTVGPVLCMTRSIRGTYMCVIMDSCFAVLNALIEINNVGVLGSLVEPVMKSIPKWQKEKLVEPLQRKE